ncbi:MAG: hypothetical protein U9P49_06175 [Thermodesulfobacteriota bacterium]|nr:hypothetical protein [Thermodesulfobacteriota bacterium]
MTREEFEKQLVEFETLVRKRLTAIINITIANRGNRDQELAFRQFIDKIQRHRKGLLRELSRVARQGQKARYFNATYSMDSQLRSMSKKEEIQTRARLRYHRIKAPVVYDIGSGPEEGKVLNISDDEILLKTAEEVPTDQGIKISISGKEARGKALRSSHTTDGNIETEVKLESPSSELLEKLKRQTLSTDKDS